MVDTILVQYKTADFNKACNIVHLTALFSFITRELIKQIMTNLMFMFITTFTLRLQDFNSDKLLQQARFDQAPLNNHYFLPRLC